MTSRLKLYDLADLNVVVEPHDHDSFQKYGDNAMGSLLNPDCTFNGCIQSMDKNKWPY